MNRLQKKCFVASAGLHVLLASVLLIGSAFVGSNSKVNPEDNMPLLDFIPVKTTDDPIKGGGDNKATPPAGLPLAKPAVPAPVQPQQPPAPVTPPPQPKAPEPVKPAPKEEVKEQPQEEPDKTPAKPDPESDSLEVSKKAKPQSHKVVVSLNKVKNPNAKALAKARAEAAAEAEAREEAQEQAAWTSKRQALARAFGNSATAIGNGVSGGTSIVLRGPGSGGVPYANFLQAVKTIYDRAWTVDPSLDEGSVTVSITIARDGTVVSSRIVRFSGNTAVDSSVKRTLNRVTQVVPLPDSAKENERTIEIRFDVKAKRALG